MFQKILLTIGGYMARGGQWAAMLFWLFTQAIQARIARLPKINYNTYNTLDKLMEVWGDGRGRK
jgi:hypothetical protein